MGPNRATRHIKYLQWLQTDQRFKRNIKFLFANWDVIVAHIQYLYAI